MYLASYDLLDTNAVDIFSLVEGLAKITEFPRPLSFFQQILILSLGKVFLWKFFVYN